MGLVKGRSMGSSSLSNVQVFTPRRHVDLPAAFNAHGSGFNRGTLLLFFYLPHPNPSRPFLMETAVRKATRLEYQPPKRKHLDSTFPHCPFSLGHSHPQPSS